MGKIARKKKGRPSKADLACRAGLLRDPPEQSQSGFDFRHCRRRDLSSYDDEEDDEDERREKKLKLVVKLPHKADYGGVDSSPNLTRTELKVAHSPAPESRAAAAAVSASSSEYGDGNKPFKKRRIDGDGAAYDGREGDDDDARSIGSGDRKKERRSHSDFKGMDCVPDIPSVSPSGIPLPDKKSLELILDELQKKDTYDVYAEPVDPEELPDYHDLIEHPMDFRTIRKKLTNGAYSNLKQFENDVFLICTNAMQYNAPVTIYFKQARSIQELARKKFQMLRIDIECTETELKSEQKTKSNSDMKNAIKKPTCRTAQEPVGSDFSSGVTLATMGDTCVRSNVMQTSSCERPDNADGLVDGYSSLNDNKPEMDEPFSGKGIPAKCGRKPILLDENRRATFNMSNQPVVRMESIITTFEGENKQLVAVGLHADHSYARSLARFAATLGPVAWKVTSQRIEQALPMGFKFGRGWVGEYEPLPTPILKLENRDQKQPPYGKNFSCTSDLRKDDTNAEGLKAIQDVAKRGSKTLNSSGMTASANLTDPAKMRPFSGPILDGNLRGLAGTKSIFNATCQQQKPSTIYKSNVEVGFNCSSSSENCSAIASQKQFECSSEIATSRLLDMVSRNRNLVQSVPFKQTDSIGVAAGGLPNGEAVTSSLDENKVRSSSPNFVSNQHTGAYFPRGSQEQGLSGPVQLMRMLAAKSQNQQKSLNNPMIDTPQVMPSVSSSRRDDSTTAAMAAARAWMSIGATDFKPPDSSGAPNVQIAASSPYNPTRELPPSVSQFCEESPGSGGLMQSEKNRFPSPAFFSQPVHVVDEARFLNNRPMVFPQPVTSDLLRFQVQSPWRGLIPHTHPKQKQEMLPPDLNIAFQSSGSPVRQASGIRVDSQQPDLALQL